jgi:hypothetical protein
VQNHFKQTSTPKCVDMLNYVGHELQHVAITIVLLAGGCSTSQSPPTATKGNWLV